MTVEEGQDIGQSEVAAESNKILAKVTKKQLCLIQFEASMKEIWDKRLSKASQSDSIPTNPMWW